MGGACKLLKSISTRHGFLALVWGLVSTQIIAILHVWVSNQVLYQKMRALDEAGFVTVPGILVQPLLTMLSSAFWGGLFFTATLGPLLILFTTVAVLIAIHLPKGRWLPTLFLWLGLMFFVNQQGFNVFATVYVTLVPLMAGLFLLRNVVVVSKTIWIKVFLCGCTGAIVLAFILVTAMPQYGFVRFRDRFLLSHSGGRAVNGFYYQYTLFAAEAIKSNHQKQMVSYRIDPQEGTNLDVETIEEKFTVYDYLRIADHPADMTIQIHATGAVMLIDRYGAALKSSLGELHSTPKKILIRFSKLSDRNSGLRQLLLIGLLVGLPLIIYVFFYVTLFQVLKWWQSPGMAAALAGFICLGLGATFWWLLWTPGPLSSQPGTLIKALEEGRRYEQLDALEALIEQRYDITAVSNYPDLLRSQDVAVRYKVARALRNHPGRQSREGVDQLLVDPNPNVRCMALQTVGRWGDPDDIPLLLETIQLSNHWYVQYYAYRALKRLGWNQSTTGAVTSN